jgi:hypothetical protein
VAKKIPTQSHPSGKIPDPKAIRHSGISFSFKHFVEKDPFTLGGVTDFYTLALIQRFKDLCSLSALELKVGRSKAIRCHPIDWADTSEPNGFTHFNATFLEQIDPYQFSLSANEHGRVHGFFVEDIFYVVWVDPRHKLYS